MPPRRRGQRVAAVVQRRRVRVAQRVDGHVVAAVARGGRSRVAPTAASRSGVIGPTIGSSPRPPDSSRQRLELARGDRGNVDHARARGGRFVRARPTTSVVAVEGAPRRAADLERAQPEVPGEQGDRAARGPRGRRSAPRARRARAGDLVAALERDLAQRRGPGWRAGGRARPRSAGCRSAAPAPRAPCSGCAPRSSSSRWWAASRGTSIATSGSSASSARWLLERPRVLARGSAGASVAAWVRKPSRTNASSVSAVAVELARRARARAAARRLSSRSNVSASPLRSNVRERWRSPSRHLTCHLPCACGRS